METNLTAEDGRKAFAHHVIEKALALREKYGPVINEGVLRAILNDRDFVRYPTRVEFDASKIEPGFFACVEAVSGSPTNEHIIFLHESLRGRPEDIANTLLYQLVVVNYGEIATREEAELFGSTALGLTQEEYYRKLCCLTDEISS